jgi:hypothetical protein
MSSYPVLQSLRRKGIPLNQELLRLPSGFRLINPTLSAIVEDDVLVLGPVSRCYLTGKVATIWKSLPGQDGKPLDLSCEAMESSAETVSAIIVLLQLGLAGNE